MVHLRTGPGLNQTRLLKAGFWALFDQTGFLYAWPIVRFLKMAVSHSSFGHKVLAIAYRAT